MKGHRYRVSVEHLATARGEAVDRPPLVFEAVNHDDIIAIAERMGASGRFEKDEAASLAIGLKLFGEVMLHRPDDPLFSEIRPAMRDFIGRLKGKKN